MSPPEALDLMVQKGGSSLNWQRSAERSVLVRLRVARSGLAMAQRRLGATSLASISATVRFSASVVSKERVRSRPMTTGALALGEGFGGVLGLVTPDVDAEEAGLAITPGAVGVQRLPRRRVHVVDID
jgi:hypothetical protein